MRFGSTERGNARTVINSTCQRSLLAFLGASRAGGIKSDRRLVSLAHFGYRVSLASRRVAFETYSRTHKASCNESSWIKLSQDCCCFAFLLALDDSCDFLAGSEKFSSGTPAWKPQLIKCLHLFLYPATDKIGDPKFECRILEQNE